MTTLLLGPWSQWFQRFQVFKSFKARQAHIIIGYLQRQQTRWGAQLRSDFTTSNWRPSSDQRLTGVMPAIKTASAQTLWWMITSSVRNVSSQEVVNVASCTRQGSNQPFFSLSIVRSKLKSKYAKVTMRKSNCNLQSQQAYTTVIWVRMSLSKI